jgi:hypothetical protein
MLFNDGIGMLELPALISAPGTYTIVNTPAFTVKLAAGITFTPQRTTLALIHLLPELEFP